MNPKSAYPASSTNKTMMFGFRISDFCAELEEQAIIDERAMKPLVIFEYFFKMSFFTD